MYIHAHTHTHRQTHTHTFWPQALHTGVSMVLSDGGGGDAKGVYYQLSFTEDYMRVQHMFVAMAATHDPQNIAEILHQAQPEKQNQKSAPL